MMNSIPCPNWSDRSQLPKIEMTPQATQTTRHKPTDCVSRNTPFGEINIPEPIRSTLTIH